MGIHWDQRILEPPCWNTCKLGIAGHPPLQTQVSGSHLLRKYLLKISSFSCFSVQTPYFTSGLSACSMVADQASNYAKQKSYSKKKSPFGNFVSFLKCRLTRSGRWEVLRILRSWETGEVPGIKGNDWVTGWRKPHGEWRASWQPTCRQRLRTMSCLVNLKKLSVQYDQYRPHSRPPP